VQAELTETLWLTERPEFSLAELAELSSLAETELRELIEYGVIAPPDPHASQWTFTGECLITIRAATRLRNDFDLEPQGVALVVTLLDRIRALEAQLRELRARMPHLGS
jgi:chaperone modulatory protein CbpM